MTTDVDPLVGTLLDRRYRVLRRVGAGGHGVVYAGHHVELGAPVAIKWVTLPDNLEDDLRADRVNRLLDEGRILVRLRHPHIAGALDLGAVAVAGRSTPYLVMEWCEGEPLSTVLERRRGAPMSVEDAFALVDALAGALAHAHAQGVAHRDVKPANVMMVGSTPRLVDFGVAKLVDEAARPGSGRTQTESPKSPFTPAYAAPEQSIGARTGPWTDVHALALLFTELVTGKRPYGNRPLPTIASVDPNRPTPASFGVDMGPFEAVIAKAMALRPRDRHHDGGAFQSDLRQAWIDYTRSPDARRVSLQSPVAPRSTVSATGPDHTDPPSTRTLGRAAPSASPTPERDGGAKPARKARRIGILGLGAALLVGASGTAAYLISVTTPPEAAPKAAVASKAGPPCAMTDEIANARAARAGWEIHQRTSTRAVLTYTLGRGKGDTYESVTWTLEDRTGINTPGTLGGFVGLQIKNLDARSGMAYGVQGTCVVIVHGLKRASTARLFDDLMRGTTWDLVGNTISGPNPANPKAGVDLSFADVPLVAKRLSSLSREEFETRMAKLGVSPTVIGREPTSVTISFAKGTATTTVTWVRIADASAFGRGLPKSAAFAADGTIAVWCLVVPSGNAKARLEEVLSGLGARIEVVP